MKEYILLFRVMIPAPISNNNTSYDDIILNKLFLGGHQCTQYMVVFGGTLLNALAKILQIADLYIFGVFMVHLKLSTLRGAKWYSSISTCLYPACAKYTDWHQAVLFGKMF